MENKNYKGFRDLFVYQKSYKLAIEISHLVKSYPRDEKYVLIDQMRRASRSIPANIAEAWASRRYPKSFVSKLVIAHGEELEMEVWLDMSLDLDYINKETHNDLSNKYIEISKMLQSMESHPEKFCY
ncbi:MAG: four helix bundle protein [Bacteroidota bacterium]